MIIRTIVIYFVCDDLLRALGNIDDSQDRMTEVMTVGLVAALYFGGNVQLFAPTSIYSKDAQA